MIHDLLPVEDDVYRLVIRSGLVIILMILIVSHSYQADTQAGGTREREAILDGNVIFFYYLIYVQFLS